MNRKTKINGNQAGNDAAHYPKNSNGSKWAAENRKNANRLNDAERAKLFERGLTLLYGKFAKKTVLTGR